ncbi:WD repeat-containing protein 81 [Entomortierella beljakovae]|nr:WD repeat-containing protein 81 [Entomortierella beljakovae]
MFGAGFNANELNALIERDLYLQVAFPSFPLESPQGHTACCVVQKSWLDQLHKGTASSLCEGNTTSNVVINTGAPSIIGVTDTKSSAGEVNVFINVISKTKPLYQRNWTRARVFAQSTVEPKSTQRKPVQRSFTTLTSLPTNNDWNLTGEDYIRELMTIEDGNSFKQNESCDESLPDYSRFQPILECEDYYKDSNSEQQQITDVSNSGIESRKLCKKLTERVLDMIYPSTLRYRVVHPTKSDSQAIPKLVLMERGSGSINKKAPSNIAAATVIIESDEAYYCLSPHRSGGSTGLTTLEDLLRFNPGNLDTSLKKGFLVYQLLRAVSGLHKDGIIHGDLKPSNIYIDENLWITLTGIKCSVPIQDTTKKPRVPIDSVMKFIEQNIPKEIQEESTVMKWAKGEISNYTYLMILNHAAGRRQGDPNVHPIFPWVTDFTGSEVCHGWRDLSKTKFRLNKGDEQLDFTFEGPIPHHITDILSDITYYVYMARQIPIPVLCQFVRSKYEANEYPSSIRRLYEWTPDECIPEFYTDPNIFKSIHADMPDMALPVWAKSPEEFIRIHREALESDYVSAHLHTWIDLTFGYKLSGPDAIEAKNVALSLFPGQSAFMKHGIIQLFTDPHPQRVRNWSISKSDFLKSLATNQSALEKASKTIKRRSTYRPQIDRSQFVDKVSDLLFRPNVPTRVRSLRQPGGAGSRPVSIVGSGGSHERESTNSGQALHSPPINALTSPISSIAQDVNIPLNSTRPEALVQFIQSEPIDLTKELQDITFTEELDHFEKTFRFGSKYHFMNGDVARSRILSDNPVPETDNSVPKEEDTFEYMQSWDVNCLGEVFKTIYLAESIPNNSIAMALKPDVTINDLTKSQSMPMVVSGTIAAMLEDNWKLRPKIEEILRKAIPALSLHSPTISMFVPSLVADIYEFLAMFYTCQGNKQMELADRWIDRICTFEDETFQIALPVFVHLFTNAETRVDALSLFPKLGQRLGINLTKTYLLKPIVALFEASKPVLPPELFNTSTTTEFLRRFGSSTFLQQLFPYYLETLIVDYGSAESITDDNSSVSSSMDNSITPIAATTQSSEDDASRKSQHENIPKLGKIASDSFVSICRSIGPILTSKHVMRPFSRLAFKELPSLPLLKATLGGIALEFGSTFALVQFSHIMHLVESTPTSITARTSNTLKNLLGLLGSLVPHMYDTQLVTELKNGGSDLIYRLIEPAPSKLTSRSDSQASLRLTIAPVLQKYFSGFGPDIDETNTKTPSAIDNKKNDQMMLAYGQLCSCVGQDAMQSMIPASDAIERLIADRLASKEFGNSPLRSLGSITVQGKFVLSTSSSSNFWQQQRNQQARDLANSKKTAFSTKDLWSATSASMSKALSLFDSTTKNKSTGTLVNGQTILPPATTTFSTSNSSNTLVSSSVAASVIGMTMSTKEYSASDRSMTDGVFGYSEGTRSPTELVPAGSLSPILGGAPAKKARQNFGSPGKAKTVAILEQLSNWNRFLSTNQEEMAKSMQFAFNDWKLQGLEGHTSGVRVIGANEYQRVMATGSKDRTVKLWSLDIHKTIENPEFADAGSGCLMTYNGHRRGPVYDLHFATGGGSFGTSDIVASCDGQIHLWEPETGRPIHQFVVGKTPVISMAPIHRSRYIVAGHADNTLSFLDSHTHLNLHTWRTTTLQGTTVRTTTINPAETLIAVGFSNGTVSLLESRTGTLVGNWRASDNDISQMKFYTNELLITSATADHTVCIWNVNTLTLVKSIRGASEIVSLEIFKDEIITMHHNNSISFTPINDDSLAYTSKFKSTAIRSPISCINILPMNQLLVLGCMEGDLYLYS